MDTTLAVLADQAHRTLARQRAQVDTAKLLVTFSTAIAATVVASALQTGQPTTLDAASSWFLLAAFLGAISVLLFDRTSGLEMPSDIRLASRFTAVALEQELQIQVIEAVAENQPKVKRILTTAFLQFLISGICGILAVMSLLSV